MSEAYEYGEDDFEEDDYDDADEMRMEIMEAEANEVWLEEPGDEEDGAELPLIPLFGLLSASGGMNIPGIPRRDPENEGEDHEDPEH